MCKLGSVCKNVGRGIEDVLTREFVETRRSGVSKRVGVQVRISVWCIEVCWCVRVVGMWVRGDMEVCRFVGVSYLGMKVCKRVVCRC